ncbi:NUDIX domain-containing protein [Ruegeria sediminis]|uniref:ADP-ribose pyrophosphatase n=1 Tax=Ruegeria sediminis TaxID=2583820 RepID=A0ABY2WWT1_9RHOB|nr:NUDIX domain-containing protein [Ruegeria sediminis]TMV06559.1 NUDIX domain-containing protein [Ruegeria sediminis]
MSTLFFYGTLRFAPLLELVLGRPAAEIDLTPAKLVDHAVHAVQDQAFPMILESPGQQADGLLVRGLNAEDIARLEYYEGGFDYDLATRTLTLPDGSRAEAEVFFPEPGLWQPGEPWSLEAWAEAWGELTLIAAEEVMSFYGRVDAQRIARSFPAIRMRAWARIAARSRARGNTRDVARDVIVHRRHHAYVDYFGLDEVELQHRQHDGSMGPVLNRNALTNGQAAVVLPYDPVRDTVLLIEQFRAPVYMIGDPDPWTWEAVAGMIDPGESPETTAFREAVEEAHVELQRLEFAGGAYSSCGSSTEYVHLFVGLGDLTGTVTNGGVDGEGEDIRSHILPFEEFMQWVDGNRIKSLQLLTLAHWLARHRDRLRGQA